MSTLKKTVIALLTFVMALAAVPTTGLAVEWTVLRDWSTLNFSVDVQGQPIKGVFASFDARIRFDPTDPASGSIKVTVQLASLQTGNIQADNLAKGAQWFGVERFGTARFASTMIRKISLGRFVAEGDLSIRDISRPVILEFELTVEGTVAHATGEMRLARRDFDVGSARSISNPVGEYVSVRFDIKAQSGPA